MQFLLLLFALKCPLSSGGRQQVLAIILLSTGMNLSESLGCFEPLFPHLQMRMHSATLHGFWGHQKWAVSTVCSQSSLKKQRLGHEGAAWRELKLENQTAHSRNGHMAVIQQGHGMGGFSCQQISLGSGMAAELHRD